MATLIRRVYDGYRHINENLSGICNIYIYKIRNKGENSIYNSMN